MSLAPLYTICLDRIYGYLKEGMWKFYFQNPFSELPTIVVHNLMDLTQSSGKDPLKIGDVLVLLTSGRLRRLDLCPFHLEAHWDSTAHRIGLSSFLNKIISWNPYLEEIHLDFLPDFEVLRQCQNLRILRIFKCDIIRNTIRNDDIFSINLSVLSSFRNLEVLNIPDIDTDMIVNVLDICPKLISIGLNDSLDSIEEIFQRPLKNSLLNFDDDSHLKLRRCVWGKDFIYFDPHVAHVYESGFRDKVRHAVNLCPLVKELIIQVPDSGGYNALRFLKQLTLLRINFNNCMGDSMPDFVALLSEIGPQLKHLSIIDIDHRYPVDVICDCCPYLQSLAIDGFTFLKNSSGTSSNLPLKRLKLYSNPPFNIESLLFLLSNCKYLEELFLKYPMFLDDTLLNQIFEMNPLTELKVSCIEDCNLTKEGYQMFIEKASSIETVLVTSGLEEYLYDVNTLLKQPNLRYLKVVEVKLKEFFYKRLNKNRF